MNVAFFSDDRTAVQVALLAYGTLRRTGGDGSSSRLAGVSATGVIATDPAATGDSHEHVLSAFPLSQFDDPAIRERVDLAVVTFGTEHGHEGAMRAMASESAQGTCQAPPAWLLGGATHLTPPTGVRTLPIAMMPFTLAETAGLRAGRPSGSLRRQAAALAAVLLVAADDPYATGIERDDVVTALNGAALGAGTEAMALRHDLLDLAEELDEISEEGPTRHARKRATDPSRRPCRHRDWHPTRRAPPAALTPVVSQDATC